MAYSLTTKSQVTLPKAIRDHLRVAPGDAVTFKIGADGSVRVEPAVAPGKRQAKALVSAQKRYSALRGSGGHGGQGSSDALMQLLRGYDEDPKDPGFAPGKAKRRP